MIARPAMASFGCRSCQRSLIRAVLAAGRPRIAAPAQRLQSPSRHIQQQNLSTTARRLRVDDNTCKTVVDTSSETKQPEEEDTPWFLEEEAPQHPPSHHQQTLPVAPAGAPEIVEPMMKYIFEDMGLDDLALFDLRELDPHAALGPNLIMLFGTARSEKHLHVSAGRFVRWIRKNHKFEAKADGLIGAGELRTKLRRLRKKAKLMGTNANIIPRGDNGISTGWICVSFNTDDGTSTADANFDATGRLAGFDAGETGTTIVVQCMTEARRQELDLETLWEGMLKRSFRDSRQVHGQEPLSADELKARVASRLQLPEGYNKAAKQWQAMEDASQIRYFSTSARRLTTESTTDEAATTHLNLDSVAMHVQDFQASGAPMEAEDLVRLIRHVFKAGPRGDDTAAERIRLVDQLLLAGEERGIALLSGDILITLVEAMVSSPAYGPALQRAQANVEFLLTERRIPPNPDQTRRLMAAYARRGDWERFWDAFRTPTRFRLARGPELYELAYATAAATHDVALCTDALRRTYPEMGREDPPVLPTGTVYDALRACVLVADPAAEELLHRPPAEASMTTLEKRSLKHREFVVLLRDVERIRKELLTEEARLERQEAMDTEIRNRFEA
ncbi:hypothetical protein ISF_07722 [Cordyceps fumosorosea ARSEF 2679]|uniref:ATPase synthesis protein 25 n=1 Tax=Cordyceps fumosorosea (strain ARSEF 2679) TaxID=1081104 RepID=A0A167NZQ1_CORFA|nr:hypothetical protein ISF_07722 [Cordyceps fumosorosea ARSEF 2679]OAA56124.1 hypothetical protein ISF_07722 [Cordyceps fumosorosea ARSEF 2679]